MLQEFRDKRVSTPHNDTHVYCMFALLKTKAIHETHEHFVCFVDQFFAAAELITM